MKKRNMKQVGLVLVGFGYRFGWTKGNIIERPIVAESKTVLKSYTVSEGELRNIATVATKDAGDAAAMINELDGYDFEAAVNRVLTKYYENGETELLKEFEENVDKKATAIIKGYEEAAEERAMAEELSYEAGVSLVNFGADVTEEEIKVL